MRFCLPPLHIKRPSRKLGQYAGASLTESSFLSGKNLSKDIFSDTCFPRLAIWNLLSEMCYSVTQIYSNTRIIATKYYIFKYKYKFSCFEYIWYSYSAKLLRTNIFNIRIRSSTEEQIYSVFVFGQVSKYEYIQYSYSVSLLVMNIFDIRIRCKFHIWIYLYSYSVKNLIFVLHCESPFLSGQA